MRICYMGTPKSTNLVSFPDLHVTYLAEVSRLGNSC